MQFSIIIPAVNEAASIVACLTALQVWRQRAEIIVVDGGSTDNTRELAQALAHQVLVSEKGRAKQMNLGARHACGEILVFLHADTTLPAQALELIAAALASQHQWGRFDVRLTGRPFLLGVVAFMMNQRSRLTGIATGDQALFMARQAFDQAGGYPDIALMEDIALSKALKRISPPANLNAKVQSSGRRWEHFGVVKTILLMWWLRLRYWLGADPALLAKLYTAGQFWRR
ncbi:TIGR04283 family arsenosugar biosynthesis glycosyltransferase [Methylosoma difficile]